MHNTHIHTRIDNGRISRRLSASSVTRSEKTSAVAMADEENPSRYVKIGKDEEVLEEESIQPGELNQPVAVSQVLSRTYTFSPCKYVCVCVYIHSIYI